MDGIEEACLSVEHKAIGIGNVTNDILWSAEVLKYLAVDATIGHGVVGGHNERRHVLADTHTGSDHRSTTDTHVRIDNDTRREDDTVENLTVASHLGTIAEGAVVFHLCVVRHMHTLHEEVAVANDGLSVAECGTVDDHILTEDILVADDEL